MIKLIHCICVTEGRHKIIDLALQSFISQLLPQDVEAKLFIYVRQQSQFDDYYNLVPHRLRTKIQVMLAPKGDKLKLSEVFAEHVIQTRDRYEAGSMIYTMWDDDDVCGPQRLYRTKRVMDHFDVVNVAAQTCGYFVNMRTLKGTFVEHAPWGGTIAWRPEANIKTWTDEPTMVGYDKQLFEGNKNHVLYMSNPTDVPYAFCHGKNVATFTRGPGYEIFADTELAPNVLKAVFKAQDFAQRAGIVPCGTDPKDLK